MAVQVRYRDGRLVSTRGEKYIVENLTEEFDGGSWGRVKTKGVGSMIAWQAFAGIHMHAALPHPVITSAAF